MKDYQTEVFDAMIPLPAEERVAMRDIAVTTREDLLAMALGTGLSVMQALVNESVTAICGPETSTTHGSEDGSVTMGDHNLS